jgi:hypothetical protein
MTLVLFEPGESRTMPSPLPRKFVEYQPSMSRRRARNIEAIAVLRSVCPVLPSMPAKGLPISSACSFSAGTFVRLGVKLQYGMQLVGDVEVTHRRARWPGRSRRARLERPRGLVDRLLLEEALGRREVHHDHAVEVVRLLEGLEVALEDGDLLAVAASRARRSCRRASRRTSVEKTAGQG